MWKQRQRLSLGNKEYDDILTLLLREQVNKEIQESNTLFKTKSEHHFSLSFEEHMKKRIMQVDTNLVKSKQKQVVLKGLAAFILFLLFALFTFYQNNQELQTKIHDFLFQSKENYQLWDTLAQTTTNCSPKEEAMMWLKQDKKQFTFLNQILWKKATLVPCFIYFHKAKNFSAQKQKNFQKSCKIFVSLSLI